MIIVVMVSRVERECRWRVAIAVVVLLVAFAIAGNASKEQHNLWR
jgi:hypothetical protein